MNISYLGLQDYLSIWQQMKQFTDARSPDTEDEIWILQHHPVYTQGQNGKAEHLLNPGDIPVVQVDRGGQITYHGPGQLIAYVLFDMRRHKMTVRDLVSAIEQAVIDLLGDYNITAQARCDAPGVYVDARKIASLGLRIRRGCSYHGLSFNINMDLEPFSRINPCGLSDIRMAQLSDFTGPITPAAIEPKLAHSLRQHLA